MRALFRDIDRLLRGEHGDGRDVPGAVPVASLVRGALLLGVTYGVFMGLYAALREQSPTVLQIALSALKVPLLFLLTLVVTFPSLYVFSALSNSPLRGEDTLRLLLAAITVNLALLASFGPVTGFFTLCTDSYPFMVLLNVAFFAVSGFVGLASLLRGVARVFSAPRTPPPPPVSAPTPAPEPPVPGAPAYGVPGGRVGDLLPPVSERVLRTTTETVAGEARARSTFRVWVLIYGVVGVQMAWVLRPFVGTPGQDVTLFRARGSNFFEALAATIHRLLG